MAKTLGAGLRHPRRPRRITTDQEGTKWVYAFGAKDGHAIKIGETRGTLRHRLGEVTRMQMGSGDAHDYVLLAAIHGSPSDETLLKRAIEKIAPGVDKGSHGEYFEPTDELVFWINWLRGMPFGVSSLDDQDVTALHYEAWMPHVTRQVPCRRFGPDDQTLFAPTLQLDGPLAGTAWAFLPDPTVATQDYFTDPAIVQAVADAMGGIDLDVASHKMAQHRLISAGVDAPADYYTRARDAFVNPWTGNVWLNPPYGENDAWFTRALDQLDAPKGMSQFCMISPVHAFTTKQARPIMDRVDAMVLFDPTPKFYNPGDPNATGTNLPHCLIYIGPRLNQFWDAFERFGHGIQIVRSKR